MTIPCSERNNPSNLLNIADYKNGCEDGAPTLKEDRFMNDINQATKKNAKTKAVKNKVVCALLVAMITVGMIALVNYEQMTYETGMAFLAMFCAVVGIRMG